jgi:hypothetical protein
LCDRTQDLRVRSQRNVSGLSEGEDRKLMKHCSPYGHGDVAMRWEAKEDRTLRRVRSCLTGRVRSAKILSGASLYST